MVPAGLGFSGKANVGVKGEETRGSAARSALLPAVVLLILVTAIGGGVLWLALTPPPQDAEATRAQIELVPSDAATSPAETAPPAGPETGPSAAPAQAQPSGPPPETPAEQASAQPDAALAPTQPEPGVPADQSRAAAGEGPDRAQTPARPEAAQRDGMAAAPVAPALPDLPPAPPSAPLPKAPDPGLVEETAKGPLPVVGRDGREAWRVYARPFNRDDNRPKVAVVLYGLGSSDAATRTAIQGLPGSITLAFTPYADELPGWIADARAAGHEVLLMVPMEPVNYPDFDPGPQALLTSLDSRQNIDRLEWMLGRGVGYVGVTDFMGSRFTSSAPHMRLFLENLRKRGLMFLESRPGARAVASEIAAVTQVPFAANTLYIDTQASRSAIDAQLGEAERLARKFGEVVAMGFLYPVTLERVARWARSVEERGLVLAPVSALARRKGP